MYRNYIKRYLDFVIASVAFLILLPIYLIVVILLFYLNNGKPFFIQLRPGKDERLFKLFKFKTMNDHLDASGNLLPDIKRLTSVGKIIRKTSIDELPQLFNVIKGDMSLIGPRPLLPRYLPYYKDEEKLRHEIRPGITGWAQVNGRNTSNWDDRLKADIYYCKNVSFKLDLNILLVTVRNVISAKDLVIDPDSILKPLDVERHYKV
ncbi:MAG: sugar transferase [Flavobacterium sp.]|nr:sugar transferase [Pedobacter sp.]